MPLLTELLQLAVGLGQEIAPGIVTPIDAAVISIFQAIATFAHPNTVAFKVANTGLKALGAAAFQPLLPQGQPVPIKVTPPAPPPAPEAP